MLVFLNRRKNKKPKGMSNVLMVHLKWFAGEQPLSGDSPKDKNHNTIFRWTLTVCTVQSHLPPADAVKF